MSRDDAAQPKNLLSTAESLYLAFLAQDTVEFSEFHERHPEWADELGHLHDRFQRNRDRDQASIFTPGLADKLFAKYPDALLPPSPAPPAPNLATSVEPVVRGEVARGGMGVIRELWDPILRRSLAMKQVRDDRQQNHEQHLLRFLREARITAQLDHPGVVPVHELRQDTEGNPYFTMRLVRGRDLRVVLSLMHEQQEGWNLTRMLEVLIKVCDTIAYAHSRGVLHRDIKPANIMVGEFGEVYVMDWGLAKSLQTADDSDEADVPEGEFETEAGELGYEEDATALGTVLGTPSFMSPEQAAGNLDQIGPAADVYALGALLYLTLTGHSPYAQDSPPPSSQQILAALQQGPPLGVTTIAPDSPSELVAICEGAMAREVANRTASAAAVGQALRQYLESEREAKEEALRAKEEARRAQTITDFLTELFVTSDPARHQGKELTAGEILDRGAERIETTLAGQPRVKADLMGTMGTIYLQLGRFPRALALLEGSLETRRQYDPTEMSREATDTLSAIAAVHMAQANYIEAERMGLRVLELTQKLYAPKSSNLGSALNNLGVCQLNTGRLGEAEGNLLGALECAEAGSGTEELGNLMGHVYNNLGSLCRQQGREGEAEKWYRKALDHNRVHLGPSHPEVAVNLNNLAGELRGLNRFEEADECYRESLELRRRLFGSVHPKVATSLTSYSVLLSLQGRLDEADAMLREAHEINLETRGRNHPSVAASYQNLAENAGARKDWVPAIDFARQSLEIRQQVLGEAKSRELADAQHTLGFILAEAGHRDEALEMLNETRALVEDLALLRLKAFIRLHTVRARLLLEKHQVDEAEAALLWIDESQLRDHPFLDLWNRLRVLLLAARGQDSAAEQLAREIASPELLPQLTDLAVAGEQMGHAGLAARYRQLARQLAPT